MGPKSSPKTSAAPSPFVVDLAPAAIIPGRLPQPPGHVYAATVGIVRSLGFIVAPLVSLALSACGHTSDPAVPCERIELGEAIAGTVAAHADSPVLAISDTPKPYVVHPVCNAEGCRLIRTFLKSDPAPVGAAQRGGDGDVEDTSLSGGSPVLLTSSGRWVVAIDTEAESILSWRIDPWAERPVTQHADRSMGEGQARVLVVGLRNSDTVVVRNDAFELGRMEPETGAFQPIAEHRPELKVIAVGDAHIIGREIVDGEHDRVVLVPVTPEAPAFYDGPVDLATLPTLSRVEITADDEFVVLTAGERDEAETFVFSIPDGELVDRFLGGAVSGPTRLDALPGLHAASPDGTVLAYRTESGALALRDLQGSTSCLVRSASGGDHRVAGFTADAMLYMQADHDLGTSHVFAFDTLTRTLTALDAHGKGHHLVAAPPRLADRARPWAVGVSRGSYFALQDGAPQASLGLQGPVFVPRGDDDSALWLADKYDDDDNQTRFGLRRFVPQLSGRAFQFDAADDAVPEIFASPAGETKLAAGLSRLSSGERPCVATGTPGGWAYQCDGAGTGSGFMAAAPLPDSETPNPRDPGSPEDQ